MNLNNKCDSTYVAKLIQEIKFRLIRKFKLFYLFKTQFEFNLERNVFQQGTNLFENS